METAAEDDFLDVLIASERVADWLDRIKNSKGPSLKRALAELSDAVQTSDAYVEEARHGGAVDVLTRLLTHIDDHGVQEVASQIISRCCGPLAVGDKVQTISFSRGSGENLELHIAEGALAEGVGARVWTVALVLSKRLINNPSFVWDLNVLEIGSGCGVCGLVAGHLGAGQVTITDYEEWVLLNLRKNMLANALVPGSTMETGPDATHAQAGCSGGAVVAETAVEAWNAGNMRVRYLSWEDSLRATAGQTESARSSPADNVVPGIPESDRFDVVLGADVLYEAEHAALVAAVLDHRLAPSGTAQLCCAVRDQGIFDEFAGHVARRGLTMHTEQLELAESEFGPLEKHSIYEGGFVLLTIKRAQ